MYAYKNIINNNIISLYWSRIGIEKIETAEPRNENAATLEITASQDLEGIEAGSTPSLICRLNAPGQIWWASNGKNLTTIKDFESGGRLDIKQASRNDTGDYKCMAQTVGGELLEKDVHIRVIGKRQLSRATLIISLFVSQTILFNAAITSLF